jgi:hypothetical protein
MKPCSSLVLLGFNEKAQNIILLFFAIRSVPWYSQKKPTPFFLAPWRHVRVVSGVVVACPLFITSEFYLLLKPNVCVVES